MSVYEPVQFSGKDNFFTGYQVLADVTHVRPRSVMTIWQECSIFADSGSIHRPSAGMAARIPA